jgi:hypothetical protein
LSRKPSQLSKRKRSPFKKNLKKSNRLRSPKKL